MKDVAGQCPTCGERGRALRRTQTPHKITTPGPYGALSGIMHFDPELDTHELLLADCPNGHRWGPEAEQGQ